MGSANRNITASVRLRMSYVTEPIFVDNLGSWVMEMTHEAGAFSVMNARGKKVIFASEDALLEHADAKAQVRADARADAKFQNMTPNEQKIAELEKKKAAAVTLEDFALAQKLTEEISAMKKEIEHLNITV